LFSAGEIQPAARIADRPVWELKPKFRAIRLDIGEPLANLVARIPTTPKLHV